MGLLLLGHGGGGGVGSAGSALPPRMLDLRPYLPGGGASGEDSGGSGNGAGDDSGGGGLRFPTDSHRRLLQELNLCAFAASEGRRAAAAAAAAAVGRLG